MLIRRSDRSFDLSLAALESGDVVIASCDTIYGFLGIVPVAGDRIACIKGRSPGHPFIQLINHISCLDALQIIPKKFQMPFLELWPGPFTFILEDLNGQDTAFRVPADARLRLLVEKVGSPLYSTSVNESGKDFLDNPAKMHEIFGQKVALVEDAGPATFQQPSTLIDIRKKPVKLLRQGAGILPEGIMAGYSG